MIRLNIKWPIKTELQVEQKSDKVLSVYAPYNQLLFQEFSSMVGYRWDKEKKCYHISDCTRNHVQLMLMKGDNPFEIFDKKLLDITPNRKVLLPHQVTMLSHAITRTQPGIMGGTLIAGDMGVGKTLAIIEYIEYLESQGIKNIWYIAPKSALNPYAGIPAEKRKWGNNSKIIFFTYEQFTKAVTENFSKYDIPQAVIFDESSKLKNPTAKRSQAALGLSTLMREKGYNNIVMMSGTPSPKNPTDWWSQCEIGAPGLLRESNITKLKARLANIEMRDGIHGKYPHLISWKEDEVELLYRRMAGFVLRIRREDCLKLPECTSIDYYIKPTAELLQVAKTINNSTVGTLEKLQKLRQLSDGFQYTDDNNLGYHWGGSPKMDILNEILEEAEDRIVVYAGYTAAIDKIVENIINQGWSVIRIDGRGWQGYSPKKTLSGYTAITNNSLNEEYFQNRNNEEPIAIVAHPKSGGMSLNFTASNIMVFYSCDFDGEAFMQASKRTDRLGQTRTNKIYHLIHLPTDELILTNLRNKIELQAISLGDFDKVYNEVKNKYQES